MAKARQRKRKYWWTDEWLNDNLSVAKVKARKMMMASAPSDSMIGVMMKYDVVGVA